MLRRLRLKFVAITVALTGLVLVGVLGSTLFTSWVTQRSIVDEALDRGLDDDLDRLPIMGKRMGPPDARDDRGGNLLALAVDVTTNGVIIKSSKTPVVINSDLLADVVEEALASTDESGTIEGLHVSWKRRYYPEDSYEGLQVDDTLVRVVIVDTTALDEAFTRQLRGDALITVTALCALVLVSWLLSTWALKPVEEAWDQQRRFVADASHELKTPLAVILANSEILARDPGVSNDAMRWVDSTLDEANHMKSLVNELLELARADEGASGGSAGALRKDDVDFSELVEAAALEFDALAFERGCLIDCEVQEGIHLTGDRDWLARMAKTLIENACKYAHADTTITVRMERKGGKARLSVHDFGTPIDPEDLPHVFERFYRSDKVRTRGTGGFGLGLAIAKGIVDAHGGRISVESSEDAGTTFTVIL